MGLEKKMEVQEPQGHKGDVEYETYGLETQSLRWMIKIKSQKLKNT